MFRCGPAVLFGFFLLPACSGKDTGPSAPVDEDGDGYTDARDCDDGDPAISPAAAEICDEIDNNCDGVVDDDATDALTWYPDNDADGYGSDRVPGQISCEDPSSSSTTYTNDSSDCDDADALVSPAASEDCSDGVDNDCDSVTDTCTAYTAVALEDAAARIRGAEAGDAAGTSVAGPGDVDGDGLDDLLVGGPEAVSAGAAWLVLGGASGEVSLLDAHARLVGEVDGDAAGASVSGGDIDGDGLADLFIGAPGDDTTEPETGATYVVYGPVRGELGLADADSKLLGHGKSDAAGTALAVVGDVDGDGGADLWVGEPYYHGSEPVGRAYLVLGPPEGSLDLRRQDGRLQGEAGSDKLGAAVSGAGDMDGDGRQDLAVGAPGASEAGDRAGRVYLALDDLRDPTSAADATARLEGEAAGDQAGVAVAGLGDLDGDGLSEVLVGAFGADAGGADAGAAYVLSGATRGAGSLGDAAGKLVGADAGDYAGFSVAGPGDVDGDGWPDLLVGAPYDDTGGDAAGAAWLVLGPVSGTVSLASADAGLLGEGSTDQAGRTVAGGGDVDADGRRDLLVGTPLDDEAGTDAGAAWLVLGAGL